LKQRKQADGKTSLDMGRRDSMPAAVLFIYFIFKKVSSFTFFSFLLVVSWRVLVIVFHMFRFKCISSRCFRDNWDQNFLYISRAEEHTGHGFVDRAQRTF